MAFLGACFGRFAAFRRRSEACLGGSLPEIRVSVFAQVALLDAILVAARSMWLNTGFCTCYSVAVESQTQNVHRVIFPLSQQVTNAVCASEGGLPSPGVS